MKLDDEGDTRSYMLYHRLIGAATGSDRYAQPNFRYVKIIIVQPAAAAEGRTLTDTDVQ